MRRNPGGGKPRVLLPIGFRQGRLEVEECIAGDGPTMVQVVCDCGTQKMLTAWEVKSGTIKSCGCLRLERSRASLTTHGFTAGGYANRHPLYATWLTMKSRCYNPRFPKYKDYGGRGIYVCERWRIDFAAFVEDVGVRPPGKTLDRKDNDGPYEKDNCIWSTPTRQSRNKRNSPMFTFDGTNKHRRDWLEITGVKFGTYRSRVAWGWPEAEALGLVPHPKSSLRHATRAPSASG